MSAQNSIDGPRPDEPADRYAYDPADPVPTIGGVNSVLTMTQGAQTPIRPGPLDQRPLEARDDVLVYTSEPLERDVEVIGPVEVVGAHVYWPPTEAQAARVRNERERTRLRSMRHLLRDTVVGNDTQILNSSLAMSLVGDATVVDGVRGQTSLGDHSEVRAGE